MSGPKSKQYTQMKAVGALGTTARRKLYRERLSAKAVTSTVGGVPLELEQGEVAGESVWASTAVLRVCGWRVSARRRPGGHFAHTLDRLEVLFAL